MTSTSVTSTSSLRQQHSFNLLRMGEAATLFSISHATIRRWDREKKILCYRTPGNTRLIDIQTLRSCLGIESEKITNGKIVCYCRCSTSKQKSHLENQEVKLRQFVIKKYGIEPIVYSEIGSGLSDSRKKYLKLIGEIVSGTVGTIVCYSSDRLSRYGNNVFKYLCDHFGIELVFMEDENSEKSFEEELVSDLLAIVTCFSARVYGKRGSDSVTKTVSDETKQRIINLQAEGRSMEGIVRVLSQEGFSYDNDDEKTPISRHVLRRLIYQYAKEDQLRGATGVNGSVDNPDQQTTLVKQFIEECCTIQEGKVFAKPLYDAFCNWSESTGKKAFSKREFGNQMKLGGYKRGKSTKGQKVWYGLMLTDNPEASHHRKI